jgi:hypothetical protein
MMAMALEQRGDLVNGAAVAGFVVMKECNPHVYLSILRYKFRADP